MPIRYSPYQFERGAGVEAAGGQPGLSSGESHQSPLGAAMRQCNSGDPDNPPRSCVVSRGGMQRRCVLAKVGMRRRLCLVLGSNVRSRAYHYAYRAVGWFDDCGGMALVEVEEQLTSRIFNMARGKSREKAEIAARQLQALDLRKSGWSYRAIGEKLGVSHVQAYNDIHDELKRLASERTDKTEELRELELERLDMLLKGLWPMAAVGNTGAVISWLKVSERRAKLLGLDAPQNVKLETWQDDYIAAIKAGRIDFEALKAVLNDQPGLAEQLFITAGVPITSGHS